MRDREDAASLQDSTAIAADPLAQSLSDRYPRLIAALATLPDGAAHLRRIVDLDRSWISQQFSPRTPPVVVEHGEVAVPPATEQVDILYAGGGLNLLNAAVMTRVHGQRVLVFDRYTVGAVHREWNISGEELDELRAVGLLDATALESIIQRRYARGLVHFHQDGIRVPPADLMMREVLDIAVDADALTAYCLEVIRAARPDNLILHGMTFQRATVGKERVVVEARTAEGEVRHFTARLMIDGMGATSPVACQLNCGEPYSLVCPTVGTVARGYRVSHDGSPGTIDADLGEILITTAPAQDGKQYIWEAFPGKDDLAAIYLFYYAETGIAADSAPESLLLPLFEEFFRQLPDYKQADDVVILKPVYGFIPAGYKNVALTARSSKVLAFDRVLSLGDAAALQSPLTFCGFGSNARNLRRVTDLLSLALRHDRLAAADLQRIHAAEVVPALARAFSKFMIAKPPEREDATQVNATLNVFCRILAELGEEPAREFFQDRVRWWDYTRLVLRTALVYPQIFPLTFRTLTWGDGASWIAAYLAFSAAAMRNAAGQLVLEPFSQTTLAQRIDDWLWQRAPRAAWRLAAAGARMRQALRVRSMRPARA